MKRIRFLLAIGSFITLHPGAYSAQIEGLPTEVWKLSGPISTLAEAEALKGSFSPDATFTATQIDFAQKLTFLGDFIDGSGTDLVGSIPDIRLTYFLLSGYIMLPAGTINFALASDDGSQVIINNTMVVNNDGLHAWSEMTGSIPLSGGLYPIQVKLFNNFGPAALRLTYDVTGGTNFTEIPTSALRPSAIPEPATRLLWISGGGILCLLGRRRKTAA